ncbi:MAG TPA: O-antigen ligase family protein [Solirubrobacterales bacterium]
MAVPAFSILLLIAVGLAFALYLLPPTSLALAIAGALAAIAVLALAVARYDAAIAFGFAIFGVVQFQPAPTDAVFMCVIAIALVTGRFDIQRVPLSVLGAVGAFATINLLSMTEVINASHAAVFVTITLYLAVFSIWLAQYVNSPRHARIVFGAYLFAAVTSALIGILALLAPLPGKEALLFDGDRAMALFKDPNVFGPFLVPAALILLEDMLVPRVLRIRASLKAGMLLLLVLGVIFSFSRAAWLNLALGIFIVFAVLLIGRGSARHAMRLLVLLMIGAAATIFVLSATGSIHFLDERAAIQHYDNQRFGAQKFGIDYAEHHPLGAGPGQFDVISPISAHSTYVRVLVEQGFLGIAILIAIIVITLVLALRNCVIGRSTYGIGAAALLGAWCGTLANSFFVDTLHWRHLWLVAALIWAGAMRRVPDQDLPPVARTSDRPRPPAPDPLEVPINSRRLAPDPH